MWWSGSKTEESCHILNDSVILMNMRRVGGRVSTQFRDSEKVLVRLTSSGPKRRVLRVRAQTEESRHKLPVSVIFFKNEGGRRVSTQFRDIQKVRVRLTSSRPKWPMWPPRAQTGESRHKLDLSVILMENEEGGRVSTHFRDSEKVRVRLTSSGPKRRMWRVRAQTEESHHKLHISVNPHEK